MESLVNEYYKPILKWAGGKRQLLPVLIKNIPDRFNTYYEPFIGGAALLISLYSLNKINESVISENQNIILKHCNWCGMENNRDAKFCDQCGEKLG